MHPNIARQLTGNQKNITQSGQNISEVGPTGTEKITTRSNLDDRLIRFIGIPCFGIIIPNLTGLFGSLYVEDTAYWLGYFYFIALAWSIWMGNRWLLFRQRRHWNWFNRPFVKLVMLLSANVFYTFPLTVGWLSAWYLFLGWPINWAVVQLVTLANVICVIFVTHGYETVFLIRERESDQLRMARVDKARALSELEALKNQIDPHFMFNSLNTLTYLIEEEPQKALLFADKLADVYRYILKSKDRNLVWLNEEIRFLKNYVFLMQLRFGDDIRFELNASGEREESQLIPPISLQLLAENALKHNRFNAKNPLAMHLVIEPGELHFTNNVWLKKEVPPSPKTGLKNLRERYLLLTQKDIEVKQSACLFEVRLPLIVT